MEAINKSAIIGYVYPFKSHNSRREVGIEWALSQEGEFTASGYVWNCSHTDYIECGQIIDEIARMFPENKLIQGVLPVWQRWHLNCMRAGSPMQESFLRNASLTHARYDDAVAFLMHAGLQPDHSCVVDGKPYLYGHRWLKEELPEEIIQEILSW